MTWQDNRRSYNTSDIYAQGVDADGDARWASDVAVSAATNVQQSSQIVSGGRS